MVMCREPLMFMPLNGCAGPNSFLAAISPGISCSAKVSSLRPNSAKSHILHLGVCHGSLLSENKNRDLISQNIAEAQSWDGTQLAHQAVAFRMLAPPWYGH